MKRHDHQCVEHTFDILFAVVLMVTKTKDADYRHGKRRKSVNNNAEATTSTERRKKEEKNIQYV